MTRWIISICLTVAIIFFLSIIPFWNKYESTKIINSNRKNVPTVFSIVKQNPEPKQMIETVSESSTKTASEKKIKKSNVSQKALSNKKISEETENKISKPEEIEQEKTDESANSNTSQNSHNSSDAIGKSQNPVDENYKSYVLEKIASNKVYPRSAREESQTGKVKLHITILPDGTLQTAEIISPCAFDLLNDAAINSVKKSAPFKKNNKAQAPMDFIFSINFLLE